MRKLIATLRAKSLAGIVVVVPIIATILALRLLLRTVDSLLGPWLSSLVGREIPGLGLLATLLLVFVAGVLATNFAGRRLLAKGDQIISSLPLVRRIYNAFKDIVESATLSRRHLLREVVMLEYPRKGIYSYGFVTSYTTRQELDESQRLANVFIPGPPIPTTGLLVAVPVDQLTYLDISTDNALKLILSLGITTPGQLRPRIAGSADAGDSR